MKNIEVKFYEATVFVNRIKVGEHVVLKKTKDGIAVTLKSITLEDFVMMTR